TGRGSWGIYGGTSLSTQLFAGVMAIVNEARALAGKSSLDGPSQTLPALYAAPSTGFHDITWGSNGYWAWPGYDLVTGLGTPNIPNLVSSLVQVGSAAAMRVSGAVAPSGSLAPAASRPAVATTQEQPTPTAAVAATALALTPIEFATSPAGLAAAQSLPSLAQPQAKGHHFVDLAIAALAEPDAPDSI
ncbi:MAG TPA: hypothetical protein VGY53_05475, partial [Isosphaeraceae bacterium]|nr:hypothetical protein [Isosphaeraceae bacterium]